MSPRSEGAAGEGTGRVPRSIYAVSPARVSAWFYSDAPGAAAAWFAVVLALVAVLVWFFVFSPYGAPASPVYAEF